MSSARLRRLALLAVLALPVFWQSGCARSAPARFYLLEAILEPAAPSGEGSLGLRVDPLPDHLRRAELATRVGPHEIAYRDFHRWAEPLDQALPGVLAENLARATGQAKVWLHPWTVAPPPTRQIRVRIERFDADPLGRVVLVADSVEDGIWQRHRLEVEADSPASEAVVAAKSQALAELAARLAKPREPTAARQ